MSQKVALVTGGMGGIGTAICNRLHDDGYTVVTTYQNQEKADHWLEQQKPHIFHTYQCDITDWDACLQLKAAVENDLQQVDILVNNAGITRDGTFKKMTPDMWRAVLSTNLDSVFNVCKQFVTEMTERGFGRVVNIASVNGQKGQFGQTNYSAAKAGMHGFTKALALETVRKGVTVNTVSPGYIATDMVKAMDEGVQDKIRALIPVGRFGTPEEVARIVSFLVADGAGFITGADFSANGGMHMY